MAARRCFVQFPHPGSEHKPGTDGKIGWNPTCYPHKRKFMQFRGQWVEEHGNIRTGKLRAWGEWEPESELIRKFHKRNGGPPYPKYLWRPYRVRKDNYRGLHNTDPLIFGDRFLYSNCRQTSQPGLRALAQASVIAFGSGKKINGCWRWMLDTVLVIRDSFPYDPLDPDLGLEGKVPDEFVGVTCKPMMSNHNCKPRGCKWNAQEFRLYRGATPDDPVCGMYSFFPAVPADRDSCFPRPVATLRPELFTDSNTRSPKGARVCRSYSELSRIWERLVTQVLDADLVVGTRAEMPECREG